METRSHEHQICCIDINRTLERGIQNCCIIINKPLNTEFQDAVSVYRETYRA